MGGADRITIPDGILATDGANLQILRDHIQDEFPEMWDLIFEDFGIAGTAIGQAFMVFLAVGIITIVYGILVCIVRPRSATGQRPGADRFLAPSHRATALNRFAEAASCVQQSPSARFRPALSACSTSSCVNSHETFNSLMTLQLGERQ